MHNWNDIWISEIIARAPKYLQDEYMLARRNPKIIHYAGPDKPWFYPFVDFVDEFWHYARIFPYYEVILRRMAETAPREQIPPTKSEPFFGKLLTKSRLNTPIEERSFA